MVDVSGILSKGKMKLCIIIPTYNEKEKIGWLVKELRQKNCDVLVVDDGSSDSTATLAESQGAMLIRHAVRMGKGVSLRDGFNFAIKNDYEAVLTMDGDGQHSPEDVLKFIDYASAFNPDMIVGNRMNNPKGMPFIRLLTNKFMSRIISTICGQEIPDSQCGFRFIKGGVLNTIRLDCSQFEIESEVLIEASRKGYKIISLPIRTIYQGEKSRINPFIDTLRFFKFIFRKLWISKF